MNLNAIRKLCLKTKSIHLFDEEGGGQWLCNGYGAWPVEGIYLDEDGLPALFNLTEKQRRDFIVKQAPVPDARWSLVRVDGEEPLDELGVIWWEDALYIALDSSRGVMLVPAELVKPVYVAKDDEIGWFARWKDGRPLIAAYGDMLVSALMAPVDNVTAASILAAPARIIHRAAFSWPDPEKDAAEAEAEAERIAGQMGIEDVKDEESGA
jgi:hypothetical protein